MPNSDFPQDLYNSRRLRHLSRAELGHRIGVSGETIRRWEVGDFEPRTPEIAHRLDVELGTSYEAMLFGTTTSSAPAPDDMRAVLAELRRVRGDLDELRSSLGVRPHRPGPGPARRGFRPTDASSVPSSPHRALAV
jgi:DNA-binding XRE family transcriptional regulator